MKIIDEKGRLFGKINIIDFLVILLLIAVIPTLYLGARIFGRMKPKVNLKKESVNIELHCWIIALEPRIAELISAGDKEYDEEGRVIGEIVSLEQAVPYVYTINLGENKKISISRPELKQISAKFRLLADIGLNKDLYYKSKQVSVNTIFEFKTQKYEVKAKPNMDRIYGDTQEKFLNFNVLLRELDEKTVKLVSVGDQETNTGGQVIAEVLKIGKAEVSTVDMDLGGGSLVGNKDMNKKQLYVKLRMRCKIDENNNIYFKEKRLVLDVPFYFSTEKYKTRVVLSKNFWADTKAFVVVNFPELDSQVSSDIKEGDIAKDIYGNVIARLVSIESKMPLKVYSIQGDRLVGFNHPNKIDLKATFEVQCNAKDEELFLYFNNSPLRTGYNFLFITDLYNISGKIISVNDGS